MNYIQARKSSTLEQIMFLNIVMKGSIISIRNVELLDIGCGIHTSAKWTRTKNEHNILEKGKVHANQCRIPKEILGSIISQCLLLYQQKSLYNIGF